MAKQDGSAPATGGDPTGPSSTPPAQDIFAGVTGDDDSSSTDSTPVGESVSETTDHGSKSPTEGSSRETAPASSTPPPAQTSSTAAPSQPASGATPPASGTPTVPPAEPPSSTAAAPTAPPAGVTPPSVDLDEQAAATGYTPEQLKAFQDQALAQLEQRYTFTPQQLQEIEEKGVHAVLPRLMAQMHINAMNSALHLIQNQSPQIFRSIYSQENAKRAFTTAFAKRWPTLMQKEHMPTVRQILSSARALNPTMDMGDLIELVGSSASVKLKLPLVQGGTGPAAPSVPAGPPTTFTPSAPSGRPSAPPARSVPAGGVDWATLAVEDTD